METRDLRLLLTLSEEGTLHRAARRLHVTPSALSQQLREIERRLGGALFLRQWRRLVPNTAGRHLAASAQGVLGELSRLEQETRQLIGGALGMVRMTCSCQQSYRWLPEVLKRYAALQPNIELSLVDDPTHDFLELLLSRKTDVALLAGKWPKDRRVSGQQLFRDELVAVVSQRHAWAKKRSVNIDAFAGEQLFSDHGAVARTAPLGGVLGAAGVTPRKTTIVPTSGTAAIELARANLGVAVLPLWTVAPMLKSQRLAAVRIGARGLALEWSLLTRREPLEPQVFALLDVLRTAHPHARSRQNIRHRAALGKTLT